MKALIFTQKLLLVAIPLIFIQCNTSNLSNSSLRLPDKKTSKQDKLRSDIVAFAKEHLGANYKYAGRNPKGFDCSGFTHFVMKNFDISVSPQSSSQAVEGARKAIKDVKPGDLVYFTRTKGGRIFHVALVTSNTNEGVKVIHSTTSKGVRIDNIHKSSYWSTKIAGARDVVSGN